MVQAGCAKTITIRETMYGSMEKDEKWSAIVLAVTMACQPAGVYAEDFSSEAEVESYAEDFSAEEETENPTEEADASLEFEDGEESGDQDNSVENEAEVEFDASEPELSEEVTVEEEERWRCCSGKRSDFRGERRCCGKWRGT